MTFNEYAARLLILGADPALRLQFLRALQHEERRIDQADRVEDGLVRCQEAAYELLIVIHDAPQLDGLRFMRELARRQILPPLIFAFRPGDESAAVTAQRMGAADVLACTVGSPFHELLPGILERVWRYSVSMELRRDLVGVLRERNEDLQTLNRAGQALAALHNTEEIIDQLLAALIDIVDASGSSLWLWEADPQTQEPFLVCAAVHHPDRPPDLLRQRLRPGEGIAGWVAAQETATIVNDVSRDPRFAATVDAESGFSTSSVLAVALRTPERVLGVLEAVNKRNDRFNEDDKAFAETLAAWAAIALDNARLVGELWQRTDELRHRNEELDAFGHTVAHDLKTPLALVAGYAELLEGGIDDLGPDERRRVLAGILDGTAHMESIIDELITMAGLREKRVELLPLDMAASVTRVVDRQLAHLIKRYGGSVEVPHAWPAARGHAPWVEQIWANYISNALKYGGRPPHILLGADTLPGGMIRFWVQDNGAGLDEVERAQLFKPFSQINGDAPGHGLGLSIVRQIVEKLSGKVSVEPIPDGGSRFGFTLPAALLLP